MNSDTGGIPEGWTPGTLREMFLRLVAANDLRCTDRHLADEMARGNLRDRMLDSQARIDQRFTLVETGTARELLALDKALNAALAAANEAGRKSDLANEKRFESVNGFREQLSEQARTFIARSEVEASVSRLSERIQEMSGLSSAWISRAEMEAVVRRNDERVQDLTNRLNLAEGHHVGSKDNKAGIYAAIGAIGLIITVVIIIANYVTSH